MREASPLFTSVTFNGTPAAWIDGYITAASMMQPQEKPAVVTAAAHAAWPTQGWLLPQLVAYLDGMLGRLQAT